MKYLDEAGAIIDSLSLDYDLHRITDLHDVILNNKSVAEINPVRYIKVELAENSKKIYIDQNFVAKFSLDKVRRQVQNAKINSQFCFLFSPYVVEDGIKMNPVYLEEYLKDVQSITDGIFFAFHRDILTTVYEEISELVERVLRWEAVTRAAEELKVVNANFCFTGYPLLRRRQKEICELNKDPSNFFKKVKDGNYEAKFTRLVNALFIKHATGFGVEDLAAGSIVVESDLNCSQKIESICGLLDKLNFCTDDRDKEIRSSYQDTQHLMHAWKADYFVTDDNNLRKRGAYVYSLLGIKTIFLSSADLMGIISAQYKQH